MPLFYSPKTPQERIAYGWNFADQLQQVEGVVAIEAVTISIRDRRGSTTGTDLTNDGTPLLSGDTAFQAATDGIPDTDYALRFRVSTDQGNTYESMDQNGDPPVITVVAS